MVCTNVYNDQLLHNLHTTHLQHLGEHYAERRLRNVELGLPVSVRLLDGSDHVRREGREAALVVFPFPDCTSGHDGGYAGRL